LLQIYLMEKRGRERMRERSEKEGGREGGRGDEEREGGREGGGMKRGSILMMRKAIDI
jgi:hypothetical protein